MKNVTNEQVQDLIFTLQGTCLDFYDTCAELGFSENDLTIEQLQEIDRWIFLCPGCGWWCERGEACDLDGEDYCEDCYEDRGHYWEDSNDDSDHFLLI